VGVTCTSSKKEKKHKRAKSTANAASKLVSKLKNSQAIVPEDFAFNEWGNGDQKLQPPPEEPMSISIGDLVDAYFAAEDLWAPALVEDMDIGDDGDIIYRIRYEGYEGDEGLEFEKPEHELKSRPALEKKGSYVGNGVSEIRGFGDGGRSSVASELTDGDREDGEASVVSTGDAPAEEDHVFSDEEKAHRLFDEEASEEGVILDAKPELSKKERAAQRQEDKVNAAREAKEQKNNEKSEKDAAKKAKAIADKAEKAETKRLQKEAAAKKLKEEAKEKARRKEERMMKEGEKLLRKKAAAEGGVHQETVDMLDHMEALEDAGGEDEGSDDDNDSDSSSGSSSEETTITDGSSQRS